MVQCATLLRCSCNSFCTPSALKFANFKARVMGDNVAAATSSTCSVATNPSNVKDLLNFRDLGHSSPDVCRSGKVFRTACPVFATTDQISALSAMGITTVVDFRAAEEVKEFGEPPLLDGAKVFCYRRRWRNMLSTPTMEVTESVLPPENEETGHAPFEIHRLSLLEVSRYVRALLPRIPPMSIAKSAVTRLWDVNASRDLLIHEVNEGGLKMLYEIIILSSMVEIGVTMKVILKALQEGHSVMFYCKAGKDRTGIVAALLLSVLGASDEQIIEDYHMSDEHGTTALGNLAGKREVEKLDRETFSRAPREAMQHLLHVIRDRHGTLSGYLEACGFDTVEQAKLRSMLSPK